MELLWEASGRRSGPVDDVALDELYAFPQNPAGPWLRANFVSTLDGRATGADGLSGSINNEADQAVFRLQRRHADVVLVGVGTALAEGYRRLAHADRPGPALIVVSNRARVPDRLREAEPDRGRAILLTCTAAGNAALDHARQDLGEDNVWVLGTDRVDLSAALTHCAHAGMPRILCEGGPTLFGDLLDADLVDELALTTVPMLLGGDGPRVAGPTAYGRSMTMQHLLVEGSTLLGLWKRADG